MALGAKVPVIEAVLPALAGGCVAQRPTREPGGVAVAFFFCNSS